MACLLVPAAARAAGPEAGVVATIPLSAGELQQIHNSGAKTARFFMFTTTSQPSEFDHPVAQLQSIGVKPVFVVVGDPRNPPLGATAIAGYTSWLKSAATRFRGKVAGWEIWNEQDAPMWWEGAPSVDDPNRDAGPYVALLKAAYAAAKSADPATPVVMGGLTGNDYKFVQSVYDNGGKGSFDVVATHTDTACNIASPYTYYRDSAGGPIGQFAFLGYRSVHDVMAANGDGDKAVWLTEFGWSTTTQVCDSGRWSGQKAGGVSEADQALFTRQAFHCMAQDPYVRKALAFKLVDDAQDNAISRFGMLRGDFSAKPVFAAFSAYAHNGDSLPASEPCGDLGGPAITIAAPTNGARFSKQLVIKVAASDGGGVGRISLLYDGANKIRNFTDRNAPANLSGRIEWMGAKRLSLGRHTLTVTAVDKAGNTSSRTVTVYKVRVGAESAGKKKAGKKAKKTAKKPKKKKRAKKVAKKK
jgi:hypothetical protein